MVLGAAKTKEEAQEAADASLLPRVSPRGGSVPPKAAGAGVVELDHSLRAARVVSFRRAGQPPRPRDKASEEADDKTTHSPAAYDVLMPFGYDIERELAAGRQPPLERVTPFIQKLGVPLVLSRKVEPSMPIGPIGKDERTRKTMIGLVIFVLVIIALLVVLIFRRL